MITICRGVEIDFEQVEEWVSETAQDGRAIKTAMNAFRRDIYLLIYNNTHLVYGSNRFYLYTELRRDSNVSDKLLRDLIDSALVESVLNLMHGEMPIQPLLALKHHADIKDWNCIFDHASELKYFEKCETNSNRIRNRKGKKKLTTSIYPNKRLIMKAIRNFYTESSTHPSSINSDSLINKPAIKPKYADWNVDYTKYQKKDRTQNTIFRM